MTTSPRRSAWATWCRLLALTLLLVGGGFAGTAQSDSPLAPSGLAGGDPAGANEPDEAVAEAASPWQRSAAWVVVKQRELHRGLTDGLQALREDLSAANVSWLLLISFLYGVFHAAGPGHGKAVISTYLLTHRTDVPRGLLLSMLASLLQALVAILLVFGLVRVAGWLSRDALHQMAVVEPVSFALIAGLGGLLVLRAARPLLRWPAIATPARGATPEGAAMSDSAALGRGCGCGHGHHVDPGRVAASGSRWPWLATLLAVGARPCTGAVIVLVAANLFGLWALGMAAVVMMAMGTAATVSILALIAVVLRDRVSRLASGGHHGVWIGRAVSAVGGLMILLLGVMLLYASLSSEGALLYTL